jgi:O-antigen/teichoic acid export membrane protein
MIWLCRSSLLTIVYGARYSAGAGALAFAGAVALLNSLNALVTTLFFAAGHPALHRRAVAASAIVMVITIYPACKLFGLMGGQVAALLAITASYVLQVVRLRGITGIDLLRYGKAFVPASLISAGILVVGLSVHSLGLGVKPLTNIAIDAAICILAYGLCVPMFMKIRETA